MSSGVWNASKYSNPAFDAAARSYLSTPAEIAAQRKATKKMGGFAAARHTRRHCVLPGLHGSQLVESQELSGRTSISQIRLTKTSLA